MTPIVTAESPRATPADDAVTPPIRVVVVDDHELVRQSIRVFVGAERDMEWVGEASDGADAVELVTRTRPDIVLMDLSMPGTDGLTATARVVSSCTSAMVLVLTSSPDPAHVRRSLDAGATAVMLKDGNPATVLAGIRAVARTPRPAGA
jgi:DNA-binding NarL/FixJ family response regulator